MRCQKKIAKIAIFYYYRNPLARQHADAADFQSEYCFAGLRRSRHGCQPPHFFCAPVPVHFAYLRRLHVWFDTLPVSVVHFMTIFWFFASFFPISLEETTWYALAENDVIKTSDRMTKIFFMISPWFYMCIISYVCYKNNKN